MDAVTPVAVVVFGAGIAYFVACWAWPFGPCPMPRCEGGKVRSPRGKNFRLCRWCKGKGSRVRWGRRICEAVTGRRTHT